MISDRKKLSFLIFGNLIEFYDFTLYAFLAPAISTIFFPHNNKIISLFGALGAFSISYFARPLGAIYFGRVGDRLGRKKALCNAVAFMGVPTLIIAITPGYELIGILAPIILIFSRLMQGVCAGGEFGGVSVFLMENCRNEERGVICGLINSSIVAGMLLGTFVSVICSLLPFENFWRVPFLLGVAISVIGYVLRRKISENAFIVSRISEEYISYKDFFKNFYKSFLSGVLVSGFAGIMFYTSFVYPNIHLTVFKGWSLRDSLILCSVGMLVYAILSPFAGKLVYRHGIKKMLLKFSLGTCVCIYPIFYVLNNNNVFSVIISFIVLALLSSFFQAGVNIFLAHLFPIKVRYRGVALSYCVGLAVFGGTVVPLLTYFKENNLDLMMGGYICFVAILASLAIYFLSINSEIYSEDYISFRERLTSERIY